MAYDDLIYEGADGVATITINRPEVRNAVRPHTYEELTDAMSRAASDPSIGGGGADGCGRQGVLFRR